jgi:hypothetical protein
MREMYATHVRCDWPDCKSEATIGYQQMPPAGWVLVPDGINIDGAMRRDFCSIHSRASLADLGERVAASQRPRS